MALGQFSSYGSVKVWEVVPILKGESNQLGITAKKKKTARLVSLAGVGYGQAMATWFVVTFYCVLISIAIYYLFGSMQAILPWTVCDDAWGSFCYASNNATNLASLNSTDLQSSSALYFKYLDFRAQPG